MAEDKAPYIDFEPGGLIDAAEFNQLQVDIQCDIEEQIEAAKTEIKEGKVKEAENAEKFADHSNQEWLDKLDERYAAKHHDHHGYSVYKRFIKKFTAKTNEVLLNHDMGRYPIVDTYELLPVTDVAPHNECKILVYYGHTDADRFKLRVKVYRDEVMMGYSLEQLLEELGVEYKDTSTIGDVINDMWAAFRKDPNDEINHCETDWISECCGQKRTVKELKDAGEWEDLHVAMKPRKCGKGTDLLAVERDDDLQVNGAALCQVEIGQANYNSLYVRVDPDVFTGGPQGILPQEEVCLMFLLRI